MINRASSYVALDWCIAVSCHKDSGDDVPEQAPFTPKTLAFLRALKRHNDREWFHAHRDDYEAHVKVPMVNAIERLGREFRTFAPDLMADPKKSLYRIWRDTRFSADKRPLKTSAAAVFPHRRGDRHNSAGLYLEISEGWVWAGGGVYMPEPPALYRIRKRIAEDHDAFRALVTARPLQAIGGLQGETLSRVPKGFLSSHPAAEYLKHKQFLAYQEWPPELMATAEFWPAVLKTFRAIAPLVAYLNDAIGVGQLRTRTSGRYDPSP
jgi:uncharacterized protein (TIGR02453 family)